MSKTSRLPHEPDSTTPAQLAALFSVARYSGQTHNLYAYRFRR